MQYFNPKEVGTAVNYSGVVFKLASGVNAKKLFSSSLTLQQSKLECL
jgi:hypothetical protein